MSRSATGTGDRLLTRLTTLRADRGQTPTPLEQTLSSAFAASGLPAPRQPADGALARLCRGEVLAPGLIRVQTHHLLGDRRGSHALRRPTLDHLLPPGSPHPGDSGLALLDTETTGLAGGTGTLAFLIGIGRYHDDRLTVTQLLMTAFGAEAALLGTAAEALTGATHVATFNGRTFDAPLLRARHRLARIPGILDTLTHIDLLHPTRRLFRNRWPDCRLQTLERTLLGFTRDDDLPSHLVPIVWSDLLRRGDGRRIPRVLAHNREDIVTLAAALPLLDRLLSGHEHRADADARAVARHLASRDPVAACAFLERHRHRLDPAGLRELAHHHRKGGRWAEATAIWEVLAGRDDQASLAALARYHEHRLRDPATALRYAERIRPGDPADPALARRLLRLRHAVGEAR